VINEILSDHSIAKCVDFVFIFLAQDFMPVYDKVLSGKLYRT